MASFNMHSSLRRAPAHPPAREKGAGRAFSVLRAASYERPAKPTLSAPFMRHSGCSDAAITPA
jgi:hypothetical protein